MSMGKMNSGDDDDDQIVAEINMTPLIDIMLVLLIVFMVSSTAALESGMDIELPKTTLTNPKKEAEILVISLSKNGNVSVHGKPVKAEEISRKIASSLAELKTDSVILSRVKTFLEKQLSQVFYCICFSFS